MKHNYSYKYENVYIRQITTKDLEHLRLWRNTPNLTKYLRKIPYITSEMQIKWFDSYIKDLNEMIFVIEETTLLKRTVGSMSLYNFVDDKAEFGKILVGDNEAHGKKVGHNAIRALLQIARSEILLKQVYLRVYSENRYAIRIYEQVGFSTIDKYYDQFGKEELLMNIYL